LDHFKQAERIMLALALVGLGASVNVKRLRQLGARPFVLGLLSWLLVVATSVFTIRLIPLNL
jgi:uncharacterized membrane protein YadS